MAPIELFSQDPDPGEELSRLQDEVLSLKHRLVTIESRLSTMESASGRFGSSCSSTSYVPGQSMPNAHFNENNTSVSSSALLSRRSPGIASTSISGVKAEARLSTHPASALSSRYGKLRSIGQGSRSLGRKGSASGSFGVNSSDTSQMPSKNPVAFKNGICIVKDLRLIGQMFLTKNINTSFERIVDHHRIRSFPFISKAATVEQVDHAINEAFKSQGHSLVADGQVGFEYAYISAGDHKLITLGPAGQPRFELSGAVLAIEFSKRECYIVVKSKLKFGPYDEILRETAQVISEESDCDNEPTFKSCPRCRHRFGRGTYEEHVFSCSTKISPLASRIKTEVDDEDPLFTFTGTDDDGLSSRSSSPHAVEHACFCRTNSDEQLLECSQPDCDKRFVEAVWRQSTTGGNLGFARRPAQAQTDASPDSAAAPSSSSPTKDRKRTREDSQPKVKAPAVRWSSRLTQK
ncbi:hypothetical protein OC845_006375 [Tilletia horrida]|nr:hypothetical protein OC845_006375 [Tilletia horrida]